MQEYYKILGLSIDATDEEIDRAYKTLKEKYSRERFYEGEIGNQAARNLTKLETAYDEIKKSRETKGKEDGNASQYDFSSVEQLIREGNLNKAQEKLDDFQERNAEWHYLQSVIFYKKNWTNECKKQLEIAMNMEPHNPKYSDAYTKLKQRMEFNEKQFRSGNANYTNDNGAYANGNTHGDSQHDRQMGDSGCGEFFDCCTTWCCMNMLCNGCCR